MIGDPYVGKICMLTLIDELTKKFLKIHYARQLGSIQVIEQLANAMIIYGIPQYILSDNGPDSPWDNGFCESFYGTFRDNFLDGETFTA